MISSKGWWAGRQNDYFTEGPFDTRDEAVDVGRDSFDDDFYIIEAETHSVRFDAQRLINDQYVENDNLFDYENCEPERLGDSASADAELQALLDAWLEKHEATFNTPNIFAWSKNSQGSTLPRHLRDGPIRPMGWEPPSDRQIILRALGQLAVLAGFFAVVWCAVVMFS